MFAAGGVITTGSLTTAGGVLNNRAGRCIDSILRTARAEGLRKEINRIEVQADQVSLHTERPSTSSGQVSEGWPRSLIFGDQNVQILPALVQHFG